LNEYMLEKMLGIVTTGVQKGFHNEFHYHPYEPTPYAALDTLFKEYQLLSNDHLVDFGCGKGRLNFYSNHLFDAHVVGVELNEVFYYEALENRNSYQTKFKYKAQKIVFHQCLAEKYEISSLENRFYFFNPFSVQIFMNVIKNILVSVEENKREVDIILYYPSEDYIYFLEAQSPFEMKLEVNLPDHNPNERFLIYRLSY
jgi:SAM-dependent methyltransferase